ncbi:hypothetical protein ACNQFZ_06615 [Schinkia sp. CFF1]
MIKRLSFLIMVVCSFLVFVEFAFASHVGYLGTSTVGGCAPSGDTSLWANTATHSDYWTSIKIGGNGTATLQMLDSTGGVISQQSFTFTASSWNTTRTFSSTDVKGLKLCLDSGSEAFFMYGETSNPSDPTATFDYTTPTFDPTPGGEEPPPDGGGEVDDPCSGYLSDINPECPDYNGGGGDTGGTEEPPPDDGGGTTDPPPSGGIECPGCEMFECPGWDDYMGKINDIIDGFPTITEAIAGQTDTIKNEIVGQPPSLPSAPSDPAPVDTYDFENSAPEMMENPDLGDSGFTLTDIENDAPEIQFNDDPTGGFDIKDPVEALPDPPTEYPIPGETDAGEWEHNPTDEVEKPQPPIVELHPYTPYPLPSDEGTAPPSPGDSGGSAPVPSTTTEIDGSYKYKTHPDNPDGV